MRCTMALYCSVLLLFGINSCINALKLPSYVEPCSLSDPKLYECARKHGQNAISSIVKGDKTYKIPNMLPLTIPEIFVKPGANLEITLRNAEIHGLENVIVKDVNFDLTTKHVLISVRIDLVTLLAEYTINGRVLFLPITGKGPANLTLVGGEFNYNFDYVLKEKRGQNYINIINPVLTYTNERTYYQLENLFNGDRRLGEEMNKFLNENWKEVGKDVGPAISETISAIVQSIASAIFNHVPYENLFLP